MTTTLRRRLSRLEAEFSSLGTEHGAELPQIIVLAPPDASGYRQPHAHETGDEYASEMQAAGLAVLTVKCRANS